MKKYLFFLSFSLFCFTSIIYAQTNTSLKYFEGGKMQPSFAKLVNTQRAENIDGKLMGYMDYAKGTALKGNSMSIGQGISFSMILIKAPKLFKMVKDRPNVMITDQGYIFLTWENSTWNLSYLEGEQYADKGARVFVLGEK